MAELRTPSSAVAASATPSLLERVSWGSVIAGAVIALAVLTVLNLIGLAIGLYVLDAQDQNLAAGGAAVTTGVWWAFSSLVSLFVGGWIAARLTGNPSQLIAGIHGAAVWAGTTLLALYMFTSAAGSVFSGAMGLVGRAAQTTTEVVSGAGDAFQPFSAVAAESLAQEMQQAGIPVEPAQLRQETQAVVNEAISPAERQELTQLAQNAAVTAAQNPDAARAAFRNLLTEAFGANGVIGPEDRAQAISALSDRLDVPEPQLRAAIDNWQQQFDAGGAELETRISQLQTEAAQVTERSADAVGDAALWTAVGLILALLAAVGGAAVGRPKLAGAPHARVETAHR